MPRVAVIGCGLIGARRAAVLPKESLRVTCDVVPERAARAAHGSTDRTTDWREVVTRDDIDAVIVATTHDQLASIGTEAARNHKHVFLEKPGARRAVELEELRRLARAYGLVVRIGFNHRYHRALRKARSLVDGDAIGAPQYVRGRYGHGARPGYEKEWRASPELAGGGEGIDQGMHLIDLSRWFLGDFNRVSGAVKTYFWEMAVEDNVFMLLETSSGGTAQLHASWTEWKNLFSFEIFGRLGKIEISGLGGSYGTERLSHYRMLPGMGPPETTAWEYPMADDSWSVETTSFLDDVRSGKPSGPSIEDAQKALSVLETLYSADLVNHASL